MATSKTKNNGPDAELSPALQSAISSAEEVLARYDKLAAVMSETAAEIPQCLREERSLFTADGADARRRFADAREHHAEAARRRAGASEGLLGVADELTRARNEVRRSQAEFGASLVGEFDARWRAACRELARLHAQAAQLSTILGTTIRTPPPYMTTVNAGTDRVEVRLAEPAVEPEGLPPALLVVGNILDRLDAASGLIGSIKQAVELNTKHYALSRIRRTRAEMVGVYEVVRRFDLMGSAFEVGALLDRSLLCDGVLYRHWVAHSIRPLEGAEVAA